MSMRCLTAFHPRGNSSLRSHCVRRPPCGGAWQFGCGFEVEKQDDPGKFEVRGTGGLTWTGNNRLVPNEASAQWTSPIGGAQAQGFLLRQTPRLDAACPHSAAYYRASDPSGIPRARLDLRETSEAYMTCPLRRVPSRNALSWIGLRDVRGAQSALAILRVLRV
ncbi:hypothetical protein BKA93DRAFT_745820 [Sparassis latifolia]